MVFKPWTLAFNCTRARLSKSPDASKPDGLGGDIAPAFASRRNVSRPKGATIDALEESCTQSGCSFTPGFNRVTGPNTSSHTKNLSTVFVVAARKPLKQFPDNQCEWRYHPVEIG